MGLISTHTTRVESRIVPVVQKVVHEGMSADRATQVLADFEEKAEKNVVQAFRSLSQPNSLNGVVAVFQDQMSQEHNVVVTFKLNGKDFTIRNNVDRSRLTDQEAARLLLDGVSRAIAEELLTNTTVELKEFFKK